MSLADIKAKIEADAKAEAEEIIGKFREQADEILAAARRESEKIQKRLEEKIRSEETEVRRRKRSWLTLKPVNWALAPGGNLSK